MESNGASLKRMTSSSTVSDEEESNGANAPVAASLPSEETPPQLTKQVSTSDPTNASEQQQNSKPKSRKRTVRSLPLAGKKNLPANSLPGPNQVDALLAQEMNLMSPDERERATLGLHGVSDIPGESPESITEAMEQVREIIEEMDPIEKRACEMAQAQDPRLLHERRFVLRFLRAAMYEPEECAQRLVSYFETKKTLFGPEKLATHITLDDLDEDDIRCLESGIMQLLPARDRAGRGIFFWNMCLRGSHSVLSKRRVQFYGLQVGSEADVVQQRGMVIISWNNGPGKMPAEEMKMAFRNPALVTMNDVRCEGFHCCVDDSEDTKIVTSAIKALVGQHTRVRFRTHSGSMAEIRKSLSTFGIPANILPFTESGEPLIHNSRAWLSRRRELEATMARKMEGASALFSLTGKSASLSNQIELTQPNKKAKKAVSGPRKVKAKTPKAAGGAKPTFTPGDKDIVMGKGRLIQDMPGNVRFRAIVRSYFNRYESLTNNQDKTVLAMQIVEDIKEGGGRFLKPT